MVPSWTETLLEAGANVVGRTRFCIHPENRVKDIPAIGGTKEIDSAALRELRADLLLLDREENPKAMAENSPVPVLATHVTGVSSVARDIERIAEWFQGRGESAVADRLREIALRWTAIDEKPSALLESWDRVPGVAKWLRKPDFAVRDARFVYVIWRAPWMAVAKGTFISSVLEKLGVAAERLWPVSLGGLYPEFEMNDLPLNAVLLLSSEPYPFHKKHDWLDDMSTPAALVDGESFSWFGTRALRFLEGSHF